MRIRRLVAGWALGSDGEAMPSHDPTNWAGADKEISDDNVLWRQYVILVDLYRYYIDILWKVTVGYYAATGAMLAYFFSHLGSEGSRYLPLLLLFLSMVSFGLFFIQWRTRPHLSEMAQWLEHIAEELNLPGRPHVEFVSEFLQLNGIMLALIGVATLIVFVITYSS